MSIEIRAAAHAALGDPRRLQIADELAVGDLTVAELSELVGMKGNLTAHHLAIMEDAGLIERRVSEGDHRRRYVSLRRDSPPPAPAPASIPVETIAFVCTHNSARSQFAAALWETKTGRSAYSAGSHPSETVHPKAIRVASDLGVDLSSASPGGYDRILTLPDLVVSVCDRARESGLPRGRSHAHWSVPDPVPAGTLDAFRIAFAEIADRISRLSLRTAGPSG